MKQVSLYELFKKFYDNSNDFFYSFMSFENDNVTGFFLIDFESDDIRVVLYDKEGSFFIGFNFNSLNNEIEKRRVLKFFKMIKIDKFKEMNFDVYNSNFYKYGNVEFI